MSDTLTTRDTAAYRINDFTRSVPRSVSPVSVPAAPMPTRRPEKKEEPKSKLQPNTKADAPLTKLSRKLTAGIHLAVLFGLIAFVISQLVLAGSAQRRQAVVKIVAPNLRQLTSPADGVFTAIRHMPNGARVEKGQILGYVHSVTHESEQESTRQELIALRRQKLALRGVRGTSQASEIRNVSERIALLKSKLAMLCDASKGMCITSPVDGTIEQGFSGEQTVRRNDSVAQVWEAGDELLVEVTAPLNVVNKLIQKGTVQARFDTATGPVYVSATPIVHSLKTVEKDSNGKPQIWGSIQCRADSIPAEVATPGAMGSL